MIPTFVRWPYYSQDFEHCGHHFDFVKFLPVFGRRISRVQYAHMEENIDQHGNKNDDPKPSELCDEKDEPESELGEIRHEMKASLLLGCSEALLVEIREQVLDGQRTGSEPAQDQPVLVQAPH